MATSGCVTVLFVKATDTSPFPDKFMVFMEHLVHPSDYSYDEIHAEVLVNNTGYSAVGLPPNRCVIKYAFNRAVLTQPFVECVDVPVTDVEEAQRIVEQLADNHATYQIPVMDFLVPSIFIRDLDLDPRDWGHLFCSQFVLLYLRVLRRHQLIRAPEYRLKHLDDCPSKTCSPAHLRHMLDRVLCSF